MEAFKQRCKQIVTKIYVFVRAAGAAVVLGMLETFGSPRGRRLLAVGALIGSALLFVMRPPIRVVAPGEVGVRINRLTGGVTVISEGPGMVLPLVQELRRYPLRDQIYKPTASASAEGAAPFQTVEGLSVGVSVAVRYALDRDRVADIAKRLPANVGQELIEPVVDGVLHRSLAKHTVREIFTTSASRFNRTSSRSCACCWAGTASCCARCSSDTSICRRSTEPGWKGCSPRSWRPRRWSSR